MDRWRKKRRRYHPALNVHDPATIRVVDMALPPPMDEDLPDRVLVYGSN